MYKDKATLVFDIETIPDITKAKQIYNLDNLSDAEAFEALKNMRRQETGGSDFLDTIYIKSFVFQLYYAWVIRCACGL